MHYMTHRILCPVLGSTTQETQEQSGLSWADSHQDGEGVGAHVIWEEAEAFSACRGDFRGTWKPPVSKMFTSLPVSTRRLFITWRQAFHTCAWQENERHWAQVQIRQACSGYNKKLSHHEDCQTMKQAAQERLCSLPSWRFSRPD